MGHIRRLVGYSLRHKRIIFGFLFFAGLGTIVNLIAPLIMIHIIDNVICDHIKKALKLSNGKIFGPGGAVAYLNMNPYTFRGKMRNFGIRLKKSV